MSKKRPSEHRRAQREGREIEGSCLFCGATESLHGHHLIPFGLGGPPTTQNITALCAQCHRDYHAGKIKVDIIRY